MLREEVQGWSTTSKHELYFEDMFGNDKTKWSTRRNPTMALLAASSVKCRSEGVFLFSAMTPRLHAELTLSRAWQLISVVLILLWAPALNRGAESI